MLYFAFEEQSQLCHDNHYYCYKDKPLFIALAKTTDTMTSPADGTTQTTTQPGETTDNLGMIFTLFLLLC